VRSSERVIGRKLSLEFVVREIANTGTAKIRETKGGEDITLSGRRVKISGRHNKNKTLIRPKSYHVHGKKLRRRALPRGSS